MAKIVSALQGIIRKALRSPEIPAFQSAACLAVIRIALKLQLNKELVMDWIGCLLKVGILFIIKDNLTLQITKRCFASHRKSAMVQNGNQFGWLVF